MSSFLCRRSSDRKRRFSTIFGHRLAKSRLALCGNRNFTSTLIFRWYKKSNSIKFNYPYYNLSTFQLGILKRFFFRQKFIRVKYIVLNFKSTVIILILLSITARWSEMICNLPRMICTILIYLNIHTLYTDYSNYFQSLVNFRHRILYDVFYYSRKSKNTFSILKLLKISKCIILLK